MVKVDGFIEMTADVSKQEATVTYDPAKTNPQELAQAITDNTEFKASVPAPAGA